MSSYDRNLKACMKFHAEHPEVMEMFDKFAIDRINRGFQKYSAKTIFERIRWETAVPFDVDPKAEFKLSNNHTAFYSRAFMNVYPQYKGFFATKEQISKRN